MHLHAFDASVRLRPTAQPAKRNGARIDQPQQPIAVAPRLTIQLTGQQPEGLGKDRHRPAPVRIRQGRAQQRPAGQMVMMLAVRVPARCQATQAVGGAELSKDQRDPMFPAPERFVVGVTVVAGHNRLESAPVDGF